MDFDLLVTVVSTNVNDYNRNKQLKKLAPSVQQFPGSKMAIILKIYGNDHHRLECFNMLISKVDSFNMTDIDSILVTFTNDHYKYKCVEKMIPFIKVEQLDLDKLKPLLDHFTNTERKGDVIYLFSRYIQVGNSRDFCQKISELSGYKAYTKICSEKNISPGVSKEYMPVRDFPTIILNDIKYVVSNNDGTSLVFNDSNGHVVLKKDSCGVIDVIHNGKTIVSKCEISDGGEFSISSGVNCDQTSDNVTVSAMSNMVIGKGATIKLGRIDVAGAVYDFS